MSDATRILFTVRGRWPSVNGGAVYLCATREQAIAKLRTFREECYTEVEIRDANGALLTEGDLSASTAGPIKSTVVDPAAAT